MGRHKSCIAAIDCASLCLCVQQAGDLVLREAYYCVIDEVDSILIDEARTPLIISGPAEKPSEK